MRVFDAHFHIIDDRFPLIPNQGYLPPSFLCADYHKFQHSLSEEHQCELIGGAVVSGSFQGYDQSYLLDALQQLGGQYVGVVQMDPEAVVSDAALYALHAKGIRAVRFNFQRGVIATSSTSSSSSTSHDSKLSAIEAFIHRINDVVGWHAEFYIRSSSLTSSSSPLFKLLATAPKVVIDHLGMDVDESEEERQGFDLLLELLGTGRNVFVKASGFGRLSVGADANVLSSRLKALVAARPQGLVFGSDMPGTRARVPFNHSHMDVLVGAMIEGQARLVLNENGRHLYNLDDHQECFQGLTWDPQYKMYALEVQAPFSQFLLNGHKTIETRDYPLPTLLQNQPLLLLETDANMPCQSSLGDFVVVETESDSCALSTTTITSNNPTASVREVAEALIPDTNTHTHFGTQPHMHSNANIRIIGAIVCSRSQQYLSEAMWRHDVGRHMVDPDSPYSWSDTKQSKKFGWHVSAVLTLEQTMEFVSSKRKGRRSDNKNTCVGEEKKSTCRNIICKRVFRSLYEVR